MGLQYPYMNGLFIRKTNQFDPMFPKVSTLTQILQILNINGPDIQHTTTDDDKLLSKFKSNIKQGQTLQLPTEELVNPPLVTNCYSVVVGNILFKIPR